PRGARAPPRAALARGVLLRDHRGRRPRRGTRRPRRRGGPVSGLRVTFAKELLSYFYSPVSYLIAVLFYLWHCALVSNLAQGFAQQQADRELFPTYSYSMPSMGWMVLLVPGILTMRCFAEERRTGSIETLMTAPVSDLGVVVGKWLAAVAFFLL